MAGARDGKPDYLDVLVVAAAPVDLRPALNLGVELARLEDMVRRSAIPIRMRRVFPPTYAQLEKELSAPELERRRREPRVLHFLGHGEMDGLWFEREDGSGERIPTDRIVRLLKGSPVKLALLNACWSATNLVASLCDRLTKEGGIPAAIGHGSEVADASAIEFAREFYRHVVLGKSVGAAKNLAASNLADQGKPGTTEVELKGEVALLLADGLAEGEREGRVEDGMPLKGSLPGTAFFAGRHDEFTEVAATLGDTEQVAYGHWGIGGIGKTALTLELARRNAWRYPGGSAWVDARDVAPPTAAGMLEFALAELEPASTAPDAASGLLRLMKEAPVLVVLDNLETLPPDEHPVLTRFLRTYLRVARKVLATRGACRAATWKYETLPIGPTEGQGPPPPGAEQEAKQNQWKQARALTRSQIVDIGGLRKRLNAKVPIVFSVRTFRNWDFQVVQETGEIPMPLPGATPDGGHAIVLVGYELNPTAPGGGAFIFRNSWGKDWARLRGRHGGGYGTLFFDYVRDNALEAYG